MTIQLSEILLVLLVALVVIKPEQLPEVGYKLGRCIKWSREMVAKFKSLATSSRE